MNAVHSALGLSQRSLMKWVLMTVVLLQFLPHCLCEVPPVIYYNNNGTVHLKNYYNLLRSSNGDPLSFGEYYGQVNAFIKREKPLNKFFTPVSQHIQEIPLFFFAVYCEYLFRSGYPKTPMIPTCPPDMDLDSVDDLVSLMCKASSGVTNAASLRNYSEVAASLANQYKWNISNGLKSFIQVVILEIDEKDRM